MAEYINKNEMMKLIKANDYMLVDRHNSRDKGMFTVGIQQALHELPTINVVHCKECKWWKPYPYKSCEGGHGITDADWFCADGERKTDE